MSGSDGCDGNGTVLRQQLEQRLNELQAEYRAGQKMLGELDGKRTELQQTLLRIGGAIQVLGELLEGELGRAADAVNHGHPPT